MSTPQSGIFALGTASHAYLELDLATGVAGAELFDLVASMRKPRTMGGVNLVAGFAPKLWRDVAPGAPPERHGFREDGDGSRRQLEPRPRLASDTEAVGRPTARRG